MQCVSTSPAMRCKCGRREQPQFHRIEQKPFPPAGARHGRSMEAEVRTILEQTLTAPVSEQNLAVATHRRFESLDLESLLIPPRQAVRNPPEFGE